MNSSQSEFLERDETGVRVKLSPSRQVVRHFVDETTNNPAAVMASGYSLQQSRLSASEPGFASGELASGTSNRPDQENLMQLGLSLVEIEIDHEAHQEIYKEYVCNHLEPDFTLNESIELGLKNINDINPDVRVGAYLSIFDIFFKSSEDLSLDTIAQVSSVYVTKIQSLAKNSEVVMLLIVLETLDYLGSNKETLTGVKVLQELMTNTPYRQIKERALLVLLKQGFNGLQAIFDSASNDYQQSKLWILEYLANTKTIKRDVFVPCCLNEIENKENNKRRNQALAIMTRFYGLLDDPKTIGFLLFALKDKNLEQPLVISCLRGLGVSGLIELLQLLQESKEKSLKINIIESLAWRETYEDFCQLRFKIIEYQKDLSNHFIPGSMFNYKGSNKPPHELIRVENSLNEERTLLDVVEINSRDFLAVIKRLISIQQQERQSDVSFSKDYSYLSLHSLFQPPDFPQKEEGIPRNITDAVARHAKDLNYPEIREAAVTTLGNIGKPEILLYLDPLTEALFDESPNVRALAAWCVSRFSQEANARIIKRLAELLLDIHWKSKVMACISLGFIGEKCSKVAMPVLVKVLRDGSINKSTVCETLIRLGEAGERCLIEELKTIKHDHLSLKSIIESFKDADYSKPSIDFVIEEIFKYST